MGALSNVITRIKALITADNKQFKKTMKDTSQETKKTTDKVNRGFKGMGTAVKAAATGVAAVIVGKIIKSITGLAKEMGLMQLKANAVFGAYRKEVDMMAKETATSMGLTETQFINAAAGIQDLLIPIGFARKEATKMTTETMKLAGAMSAWTGGMYSAEEVGQIFSKAVLGEREQLKSLGIAISEAEVKSRLLAKGQASLTGQALAQAKAQATLELITEKSTDAQTAFAEGQGNIVIKSAQVTANIRSMAEGFTKILQPALSTVTDLMVTMTTTLRQMMDDAVLIANSDVLTTWEKWQYRIAGMSGTAAGLVRQMEILGMAASATEFDAMVDELLNVDATIEQVEKALEGFGPMAVEHGRKYYQEQKKLRDKDAKEVEAAQKATQEQQAQAQKDFYWAMEGHAMAHGEAVKSALMEGYKGAGAAIQGANEGIERYHSNLGELMEQMPLLLPMIEAQTQAYYDQVAAEEKREARAEQFKNALWTLEEAAFQASYAMVQASSQSGISFKEMANAAVDSAKRVVSAAIAEGIAKQVASALSSVPFPFGLIAGSLAGGAAAALFNQLIPSFAEGGMVTGPTLALVGDNPSGKEMIIPWEKLGEMGGGSVEVGGVLRGHDQYLMNKRYGQKLSRTGRI